MKSPVRTTLVAPPPLAVLLGCITIGVSAADRPSSFEILVVEDEAQVRTLLAKLLEKNVNMKKRREYNQDTLN